MLNPNNRRVKEAKDITPGDTIVFSRGDRRVEACRRTRKASQNEPYREYDVVAVTFVGRKRVRYWRPGEVVVVRP